MTRSDPVPLDSLSDADIEAMRWYYNVELKPGVFTDARIRGSVGVPREILRKIDLRGQRCLDLGTQEGLLPTMMVRQGAQHVAAYDRLDLSDRIDLIRQAYDVDFDYYHSLELNELPGRLESEGVAPFDVVVFAGVLYHMIDPLAGLATTRSFVREGGLAIVETSVMARGDFTAEVNAAGRFYPGSNYFQLSLGTLDYFLRMLRFEPLDLLYIEPSDDNVTRATIVARAVDSVVAVGDDTWMKGAWVWRDMASAHLHYDKLASAAPAVKYEPINPKLRHYRGTDIVDVWSTFEKSKPFRLTKDGGRLRLGDQS